MEDALTELEQEIRELQIEQIRLGATLEMRYESEKLARFVPTKAQEPFFNNADKPVRGSFCGNRWGKSTIGTVEDCCWLLGERPFFPEGDPRRRLGIPERGVKGLVVCEDFDNVKDIFTNNEAKDRLGKFFEYLPAKNIKGYAKDQKGRIITITVVNVLDGKERESIIVFDTVQSYKMNPKAFESKDWDFFHVDEPVMRELYTAVSRGLLDRGGFVWMLLTPLGYPWMFDYVTKGMKSDPSTFFALTGSMDDNPTLDDKTKARYLSTLSEDELACRRDGKPLAYGRRVYGHFDEMRHVLREKPAGWLDEVTPPASYAVTVAIDLHQQTPQAVLFTAVAPDGSVYFYDEIFKRLTVGEVAQEIIKRLSRVRYVAIICDPSAWNENQDTGRSWALTLLEHGLDVQRASKERKFGTIQTQEIFKLGYKKKVFVLGHMTNFLREISNYCFDKENKPMDKDDHMMECLYRTVVHNDLAYVEPVSENSDFYSSSMSQEGRVMLGNEDRITI